MGILSKQHEQMKLGLQSGVKDYVNNINIGSIKFSSYGKTFSGLCLGL